MKEQFPIVKPKKINSKQINSPNIYTIHVMLSDININQKHTFPR